MTGLLLLLLGSALLGQVLGFVRGFFVCFWWEMLLMAFFQAVDYKLVG